MLQSNLEGKSKETSAASEKSFVARTTARNLEFESHLGRAFGSASRIIRKPLIE
jgi:hypothetical protein